MNYLSYGSSVYWTFKKSPLDLFWFQNKIAHLFQSHINILLQSLFFTFLLSLSGHTVLCLKSKTPKSLWLVFTRQRFMSGTSERNDAFIYCCHSVADRWLYWLLINSPAMSSQGDETERGENFGSTQDKETFDGHSFFLLMSLCMAWMRV